MFSSYLKFPIFNFNHKGFYLIIGGIFDVFFHYLFVGQICLLATFNLESHFLLFISKQNLFIKYFSSVKFYGVLQSSPLKKNFVLEVTCSISDKWILSIKFLWFMGSACFCCATLIFFGYWRLFFQHLAFKALLGSGLIILLLSWNHMWFSYEISQDALDCCIC